MLTYATESINFRGRGLFTALVRVVTKLRLDNTYNTDSINQSGFTDVIKDYTGMNVNLHIVPNDKGLGATARIPVFDINHPLLKGIALNKGRLGTTDSLRVLQQLGKQLEGGIDKKIGRVSGFYSSLAMDIEISTGLFKSVLINDEHIAAIICHELGHIFTYFEFMGTVAFGALVVGETSRQVLGVEFPEKRRDIITFSNDLLGVDRFSEDDLDRLANSPKNTHVVLLRNYISKAANSDQNTPYDYRNIEQVADMFAVKHGAGRAMASYLEAHGKANFDASSLSTAMFIFVNTVVGLYRFLQGLGAPAYGISALLLSSPSVKLYDTPEARIQYIRKYLAGEVNSQADETQKVAIHRDIEAIDKILENVNDKRTLLTVFWESIPGEAKNRRKQEIAAKQLESLLYNDLQYQAEQLTTNVSNIN